MMWAFVAWGYTLLPAASDLTRFPVLDDCAAQATAWRRHLTWLHLAESLAPWPQQSRYREWQRQTRDLIGLWETLQQAHLLHDGPWEDDCRLTLAALRRRLGADAYACGRMPWCPVAWELPAWVDP